MTFKPGRSGNPKGPLKGKPHKLTSLVRKMVNDKGGSVVAKIIERAEAGDADAARIFVRYLLPRPRLVTTPVDLKPAQTAAQAREQIGVLTSMAAAGDLDLDALHALSQALHMAISTRIEELARHRQSAGSDRRLFGPSQKRRAAPTAAHRASGQ